jgi:hypothetical protein
VGDQDHSLLYANNYYCKNSIFMSVWHRTYVTAPLKIQFTYFDEKYDLYIHIT